MKTKVAVVDGIRTPFAKAFGTLRHTSADELGTVTVKELLNRTGLNPSKVDEVIVGCVGQPSDAMNIARVIALQAGIPKEVPAYTVHRNCASSMEAITSAAEKIMTGRAEVVIAGGTESMSNYPFKANLKYVGFLGKLQRSKSLFQKLKTLFSFRPSMLSIKPTLEEGLTDKTCGLIMGETAENLAKEFSISREEQDQYALESHQKVSQAYNEEKFLDEVMSLTLFDGTMLTKDKGFRPNQSLEALAKLKPYFDKENGTVTVGNSCPLTDGAAMLLLMPLDKAKAEGYDVLGVLEEYSYVGLDPERMGLGPVFATADLFNKTDMSVEDIDLFEINEAFASQVLACLMAFGSYKFGKEELGLDDYLGAIPPHKLNVNGGAIGYGHPVGATGARLVLTLLNELKRRNENLGVASLCVGGGLGASMLLSHGMNNE